MPPREWERAPEWQIETTSRPHDRREIYKNLTTRWVGTAIMNEHLVGETSMPMPPGRLKRGERLGK